MFGFRSSLALVFVAGAFVGCAEGRVSDAEGTADDANQLTAEQPNGVAEVVARRYLLDPEVLHTSNATPSIGGCSATMIGPNVAMSAAHCGFTDKTITFRTYRLGSVTKSDTESFPCRRLVNSFPDTDMFLMFCEPNAEGENPGDKYGYLDFDTSAPTVNQQLYSVWTNSVDSLGLPDARIYSAGRILSTTGAGWFTPPNMNVALASSVWGQPGASGSSLINPANQRVIGGPTSTANPTTRQRYQLSMRTYLQSASLEARFTAVPGLGEAINIPAVRAHGIDPNQLVGGLDKNQNGIIDVQESLERRRGENRRDHYFLGFESERRNALWETYAGASIDVPNRLAHISTKGPAVVMSHHRLNLAPHTVYRFSIMMSTSWTYSKQGLEVRLVGVEGVDENGSAVATVNSQAFVSTKPAGGWETRAFMMTTGSESVHELTFVAADAMDVSISAISLVSTQSSMNFDTLDKRANWRNENTGKRAFVMPDGVTEGTPNWAGYVYRDVARTRGNDWPLRNGQLAFVQNGTHRVCFDVKQFAGMKYADAWGVVRVVGPKGELARMNFNPSYDWKSFCTNEFFVGTGSAALMFGTDYDYGTSLPSYLVDNIEVSAY